MEALRRKLDDQFYEELKKVLLALSDYREDLIICGGIANALYSFHNKAESTNLESIYTKDIDILTDSKVKSHTETIVDLLEQHGFKIKPIAIGNKYLTKFIFEGDKTGFDIEFLCPMKGRDPDKNGNYQLTKEVQEGLIAQPLRYLDIALYNPILLHTDSIPRLKGLNFYIQIPNFGSYIIQKFLIRGERKPSDLQKDCFYTYELLLKFFNNLEIIAKDISGVIEEGDFKYKKVKSFKSDFQNYYSNEGLSQIEKEALNRGYELGMEDISLIFEKLFSYF